MHLSHAQIEIRAYQLWEDRGHPWGTPEVDWFRAEHELAEAGPDHTLAGLAREVGHALGTAVALVSKLAHDGSHPE